MIESVLRTRMLASTALANIVGDAVYPDAAPQSATPPFIVYSIDNAPMHDLSGNLLANRGVLACTAYATTRSQARSMAHELASQLDGYRTTTGAVTIDVCSLTSEESAKEFRTEEGTDEGYYRTGQTYEVWWME